MRADSGMSKHNTEARVDTGLMPHFAASRRHVIALVTCEDESLHTQLMS
jgi:hypothetical protein